jgi:trehalose 6-phosphate synthase
VQAKRLIDHYARDHHLRLHGVRLSSHEERAFYQGACNETLWPILHGFPEMSQLHAPQALTYRTVNRRFANEVATSAADSTIWVHDYHLMQVGEELRRHVPWARIGFFLHTPFPEPEGLSSFPWGWSLLRSLRAFDLVGFQTERDRKNFHAWEEACGERLGSRSRDSGLTARTGSFPISVDLAAFHQGAASPGVVARAREIRAQAGERHILLGVDRLDYTKGIPERIAAYGLMLERHPELRDRVVLTQLAVPSRTGIPAYEATRQRVERTVRQVNDRFGTPAWKPVEYRYGTWDTEELLAWYVAAHVAVVTPIRDGMNLVAKEFAAANRGDGVLVLSRGAGAAEELAVGALLANGGTDVTDLATALRTAVTMPMEERRCRSRRIQALLRENDVHRWADSFLQALQRTAEHRSRRVVAVPALVD